MCQGVIGIVEPQTMAIHWGTGSHTDLIKQLWPNSATNAGDKLVKFEADLAEGPGYFTTEGCNAAYTQEMKDFIKSELLAKVPDFNGLIKYILSQSKFDWSFVAGVFTNGVYYKVEDHFGSYGPEAARAAKKLANSFGSDRDMLYRANANLENEIANQRNAEIEKASTDYITFSKAKYLIDSIKDSNSLSSLIENLKIVKMEVDVLVSKINTMYDNKLSIARTMAKTGTIDNSNLEKLRADKAAAMTTYIKMIADKMVEVYNSDPTGNLGIVRKTWAKKADEVKDTNPTGGKKLPKIGKGTVIDPIK